MMILIACPDMNNPMPAATIKRQRRQTTRKAQGNRLNCRQRHRLSYCPASGCQHQNRAWFGGRCWGKKGQGRRCCLQTSHGLAVLAR